MTKRFRTQILSVLGIDKPDEVQELLIESAEKYKTLANKAFKRIGNLDSSNTLGAANAFTKSTTELLRILKLLGLTHSTSAQQKQLGDFFKNKKVIRGKK